MVFRMPTLVNVTEDDARTEETLRASIRAAMAVRNMNTDELAQATGLGRSCLYRKMAAEGARRGFLAREIALVAAALDVDPGELYKPLTLTLVSA